MMDEDLEALQLLASFQLSERQWEDAIASLQQLITLQPDNPDYYNNLGLAWLQLGTLEEAIASFQTVLQLNPYATEFVDDILHQLALEGKFDIVTQLAFHLLQVNPIWERGFSYINYALQQQGASQDLANDCLLGMIPTSLVRQFYPNLTLTSVATATTDFLAECYFINESERVDLSSPQTIETDVHPNLVSHQIYTSPTYVVSLPGGRVWADPYTRAVFTSEGALVEDISTGNAALVASSDRLPAPIQFQGAIACLTIRYSQNYFHWMYDLLPKLEMLEKSSFSIDTLDAVLVNQCQYPFQRTLLNLMGVPDEKILDHLVFQVVADQLVIPIASFNVGRFSKQSCDFLRHKLLPQQASKPQPTRFYISRQRAAYRNVQNEAEVTAYLHQFGFEMVHLETLTVQEQIALFAQADAIVAPHGAGLANLVFCKPGTKVIELFLPDEVLDYYLLISQYINLDYYHLVASKTESFAIGDSNQRLVPRSMVVQLEELEKILRFARLD